MAGEDGTRSGIRKDCPLECCRAAALDWSALAACPGAHDIEGSRGTIWEGTEQDGACEGGETRSLRAAGRQSASVLRGPRERGGDKGRHLGQVLKYTAGSL